MSVILIVGPKCTLAASHAAPPPVSHGKYADGTDRQTDGQTVGRQTVTLRFPLDAVSVIAVLKTCNSQI